MLHHSAQSEKPGTTRRRFIQQCASMTSGSISATLLQMQLTRQLLAQGSNSGSGSGSNPGSGSGSGGFKALVCLFLDGGNDSFNMLVPYETNEYADYLSIRQEPSLGGLALSKDSLLPILTPGGRSFGLHPAMSEMKSLYDAGDLAFVANVGSLLQPTDIADYQNRVDLPLGLFSHSDLQRHWQTSMPQSRSAATGWGGRVADLLTDPSKRDDPIAMSMSVDRVNVFQAAEYANPYVISASGATEFEAYRSNWAPDLIFRGAFDQMLDRTESDLVRRSYSALTQQSIEAATLYNEATQAVTFETVFPSSYFGRQMERIARTIASAGSLEHQQQLFFVSSGGWDHHAGLLGPQNTMLGEVSAALGAFQTCLAELGLDDDVVTFSASDFGRTLAGNGQGSDHGWGGNQFVIGGPVAGGNVYGDYPLSLAEGNPLDVGRGRLIPTTSVDEYAAELLLWMGIANNADMEIVLPNIRNFYASNASSAPLGFISEG